MIGALGISGLEALMTVEGAPNGEVFRAYVKCVLGRTLKRGDIVVMDNLGAHKVKGIREAIEARGAKLIYLPPYSPDLSPIERCWSKLKTVLRTRGRGRIEHWRERLSAPSPRSLRLTLGRGSLIVGTR
jgi:transposase